jgi:REP element-mobilizing transposase RayT
MGLRFPEQIFGHCFFVTTTLADWRRLGDKEGIYQAITESLAFCLDKYSARLVAYVFMPDHIHLLLLVNGRRLAAFMRDFKKFTAQKAFPDSGVRSNPAWMPRYDRVAVYSEKVLKTKLRYIHENPVKADLVVRAEDWLWSSAADYSGRIGPLPVWTEWFF